MENTALTASQVSDLIASLRPNRSIQLTWQPSGYNSPITSHLTARRRQGLFWLTQAGHRPYFGVLNFLASDLHHSPIFGATPAPTPPTPAGGRP